LECDKVSFVVVGKKKSRSHRSGECGGSSYSFYGISLTGKEEHLIAPKFYQRVNLVHLTRFH